MKSWRLPKSWHQSRILEPGVRRHVVITGTGRAGTSFLVQLLTRLGLPTGFDVDTLSVDEVARAGLESDVRNSDAPYITKSPWFCDYAAEVIARPDIAIDRVLIPVRDLQAAAESRRHVVEKTITADGAAMRPSEVRGGLWHTDHAENQEQILLEQIYKLVLALADAHIPVTLLRYPRITRDSDYLFKKLEPILGAMDSKAFSKGFAETVKPDWVNQFTETDT